MSGSMGAKCLSSTGLGFGALIGRAHFFPVPALDTHWSPDKRKDLKRYRSRIASAPRHELSLDNSRNSSSAHLFTMFLMSSTLFLGWRVGAEQKGGGYVGTRGAGQNARVGGGSEEVCGVSSPISQICCLLLLSGSLGSLNKPCLATP